MLGSRFQPVVQKRIGLALGVWGEAGIGKSYQVKELLHNLACRNLSLHAMTPISILAYRLPKPKKFPLWAEGNLKRLANGEAVESSRVLDSLGALLSGLAPVVLHLEDIHEADSERLELITSLAKMLQRIKGVALVITSRKEPPEPFLAIKLEPLSPQDSEQLLETELKNPLPKDFLAWLYDKAAGNPLYSLEYLRYLTRQGFLWSDGMSWHWRKPPSDIMPVTVEALIEQRLKQARSEPLLNYVLEAKALLPLESSTEVWQKVARVNEQELQAATTELSQLDIFKDNTFAHPLFREVTLKTLTAERKRHLARRAINVFKDRPDQAAMFVEEAGLEPETILNLLKKAAGFVNNSSEVDAARLLAKAVGYATGQEKTRLALEAASMLHKYNVEETKRLIAEIDVHCLHDPLELYRYAFVLAGQGKAKEVETIFSRMPDEEQGLLRYLENHITARTMLDDYKGVLSLWENYPWQKTATANLLNRVASAMIHLGDTRPALDLLTKALEREDLTSSEQRSLLASTGYYYFIESNYSATEACLAKLIASYRAVNQVPATQNLFLYALAVKTLGRLQEAIPPLQEALEIESVRGNSLMYADINGLLGELFTELGDYAKAETLLLEGQATLNKLSITGAVYTAQLNCQGTLHDLYSDWGSPHSGLLALKHGHNALNFARTSQNPRSIPEGLYYAAMAEANFGNSQQALILAEEAVAIAEIRQEPRQLFLTTRARGLALMALGQRDEACTELMKAIDIATRAGIELKAVKTGLELDRLNNDIESARVRMQWFAERGLLNGVNITKRYFPELGKAKEMTKELVSSVRLEVLGTLRVTGNETLSIRGRKRQQLLALLLEARLSGRTELSRLSLLDKLYPEEDELKAGSSLKVIVHSLRETLNENAITTTNTGYALGACTSDAELFLQSGETKLWRGIYLEGLDLEGLDLEESTVRDSLYLALYDKVKSLFDQDSREAARIGEILVEAEPYNIEFLKLYLNALRLSKNHGKLSRHYQEARERMVEVDERLPEMWQSFLS